VTIILSGYQEAIGQIITTPPDSIALGTNGERKRLESGLQAAVDQILEDRLDGSRLAVLTGLGKEFA
jgi:hypothetical protein